jgi:hypothetical protein
MFIRAVAVWCFLARRVSTTTELNVVLLAIETPLIMYYRLNSWCAGVIDNREVYSLAYH